MQDIKHLDSAIKTPGFVKQYMVKCGKEKCRCYKGELHGPYYYYRYWKLHHKVWKQKKRYVRDNTAEALIHAIEKYKDVIKITNQDTYRQIRKIVKRNISAGVSGMTQRKLSSTSVLVKSFTS